MEDYNKFEDVKPEDIKPEDINQEDTEQEESMDGGSNSKHCFKLTKVYDWRKLKSIQNFSFPIPPTDLEAIEDAIAEGHSIILDAHVDSVVTTVIEIERERYEDHGCIVLQKIITVHVQITDEFDGSLLSNFFRTVQLFDSTKACIPYPLNKTNVSVKVVASDATVRSSAPVNGEITVEISTCQDIEVLLDVKAKLQTYGYCKSKEGYPCAGSVPCEAGHECYRYPKTCNGHPGSCW